MVILQLALLVRTVDARIRVGAEICCHEQSHEQIEKEVPLLSIKNDTVVALLRAAPLALQPLQLGKMYSVFSQRFSWWQCLKNFSMQRATCGLASPIL